MVSFFFPGRAHTEDENQQEQAHVALPRQIHIYICKNCWNNHLLLGVISCSSQGFWGWGYGTMWNTVEEKIRTRGWLCVFPGYPKEQVIRALVPPSGIGRNCWHFIVPPVIGTLGLALPSRVTRRVWKTPVVPRMEYTWMILALTWTGSTRNG